MEESNPSQIAFTLSWKRVYVKSNLTQSIILFRLLRISTQARGKNVNDRKTGEAEAMKRCNKWSVKQRKQKRERERERTKPLVWLVLFIGFEGYRLLLLLLLRVCVLGAVVCGGERKTDSGAEGAGMGGGMMDLHLLDECRP